MLFFSHIFEWARTLPPGGFYLFIFLWLFVESTGFPISDEPLLLLAGYLTTRHRIDLLPTLLIALVGKVLASCLAYWIGMHIPLQRLARPAVQPASGFRRWIYHIRPTAHAIETVEQRFRQQGAWGVFLGRLIPIVRSFISYPAGTARMSFPIFLAATTAGSFIWIAAWTILGAVAGRSARTLSGPAGLILLGLGVVALAIALFWNHRRQERKSRELYEAAQEEKKAQLKQETNERKIVRSSPIARPQVNSTRTIQAQPHAKPTIAKAPKR
ncbi:MAG TPA: DedA family protein [Ktedonobacterales bacterium]|nr:DedA family protein [Ktedonobacterales bacterium]